jgi:hypothetical protein
MRARCLSRPSFFLLVIPAKAGYSAFAFSIQIVIPAKAGFRLSPE